MAREDKSDPSGPWSPSPFVTYRDLYDKTDQIHAEVDRVATKVTRLQIAVYVQIGIGGALLAVKGSPVTETAAQLLRHLT